MLTSGSALTGTQQETTPLTRPGQRSGFLGAPSALPAGVVETQPAETAAAVAAVAALAAAGRFMVQVGAIGDAQRAISWQKSLSDRFSVPVSLPM